MQQDKLSNIRHNLINGNKFDAKCGMFDYGLLSFPIDYLNYLQSLGFMSDTIIVEEMNSALNTMSYINSTHQAM